MLEAAANQGGATIITIRSNLQKMVGEADANVLLTAPDTGGVQLASLGPLLSLTQLAKGEIDRATFARRFGHRGPHEAEVSTRAQVRTRTGSISSSTACVRQKRMSPRCSPARKRHASPLGRGYIDFTRGRKHRYAARLTAGRPSPENAKRRAPRWFGPSGCYAPLSSAPVN